MNGEAATKGPRTERGHRVRATLEAIAHLLPDQGPLSVFIHHNTLHGLAHLPFHEAVQKAYHLYGAEPYLTEEAYRTALSRGRIEARDLDEALRAESTEDRPLLGGRLSLHAARRLVLHHGIEPLSPVELEYRIDEQGLLRSLDPDLPPDLRARIREGSEAFVVAQIGGASMDDLAALFSGSTDAKVGADLFTRATGHAFTRSALRRLSAAAPETLIALTLHGAAQRLAAASWPVSSPASRSPQTDEHPSTTLASASIAALVPILAAYLDFGFAYWPMPQRERGLLAATHHLVTTLPSRATPLFAALREALTEVSAGETHPADVIAEMLADEGVSEDAQSSRLTRSLLALPGWAGMFQRLEHQPGDRPGGAPPASLADLTALLLVFERASRRVAERDPESRTARDSEELAVSNTYRLYRLFQLAGLPTPAALALQEQDAVAAIEALDAFDPLLRRKILHEAYEGSYRRRALHAVQASSARTSIASAAKTAQFLFCIDDREESIRRHLEELDPGHETFGVAGFFGLAMAYRSLDDAREAAFCPAGREPMLRALEAPHPEDMHHAEGRRRRRRLASYGRRLFGVGSRGFVRGHVLSLLVGIFASFPLLARVRWPRLTARLRRIFDRMFFPSPRTRIHARSLEATEALTALSSRIAADAIGRLLEDIGLTREFAPVIFVLGHGSSSRNNPHESAYDCGACGGRKGGANGRLFASLANDPDVRAHLRERGIDIPEATVFVGGLHDTTNDAITLYDLDALPEVARARVRRLEPVLDEARMRSAHERCRRFLTFPRGASKAAALRHVEARSESLAEPRPEYGHATNALCIVGRRAKTRGLFLDRRAFLVSYDPTIDPSGAILERILAAVGPVGSGISLEYYFSTVDNERYGCGTKLPHNVTGYLGVMNGHLGDLRTGLTRQMIELHEPMRLLLIVEAKPETLLAIAGRRPELHELIVGRWIQLAAIDPDDATVSYFSERGFVPFVSEEPALQVVASSEAHYLGRTDHLPFVRIQSSSRAERRPHAA